MSKDMDTVKVELTPDQWHQVLADLNLHRIANWDDFPASARHTKRIGAEIARQTGAELFAGEDTADIEPPRH